MCADHSVSFRGSGEGCDLNGRLSSVICWMGSEEGRWAKHRSLICRLEYHNPMLHMLEILYCVYTVFTQNNINTCLSKRDLHVFM